MKPNENLACDVCGRFGAYEMGDQRLCGDCFQSRQSCCPEFGDFDLWNVEENGPDKPEVEKNPDPAKRRPH